MTEEPFVSLIIPVWRDEDALTRTLAHLTTTPRDDVEVIVATVLGEEPRYQSLRDRHSAVTWVSAPRGRASQMNRGAATASGRWLVFLHADSELPPDWLSVVSELDSRTDVAAGAFRLRLDSRDWRARLIEVGAWRRVTLLGVPYGDQALFVRRHIFNAIGGYRDQPLMEDIELVPRLKAAGRLVQSRSAVVTSARCWEREGWWHRSAQNVALATWFLLGASPARLAQRYFGRQAAAVVMMARAPWTGGKTRLGALTNEAAHAELRQALFLDNLDAVTSVPDTEHIIACEPATECERIREFVGTRVDVIAQRGDDRGQRIMHVFEDVVRLGAESVIVVGSDLPDLPLRLVRDALAVLRGHTDRIAVGPATDGGYYLIGMNRPNPQLFDGIDWGTDRVFVQTRDAAKTRGLHVALLDEWADVDDAADLMRLGHRTRDIGATRTRAWIREHWRVKRYRTRLIAQTTRNRQSRSMNRCSTAPPTTSGFAHVALR